MKEVKIMLDGGIMPTLGSRYAAAYDLYVPEDFELKVGRQKIDLGFYVELPLWWKANIRPRSGFSTYGVEVTRVVLYMDGLEDKVETIRINADILLGLVDCDYRGRVGVTIAVHSLDYLTHLGNIKSVRYYIPKGTRIAQMELCKGGEVHLIETDELDMSNDRGGGFGHTGTM